MKLVMAYIPITEPKLLNSSVLQPTSLISKNASRNANRILIFGETTLFVCITVSDLSFHSST